MWSHCLRMLISSGLLLSFLLVSCSDDTSSSDDAGNGTTDGSDLGATGNGTTSGSASATTAGGATSGDTGGGSVEQLNLPEEHWISSVPFQKIEAGSFKMGSPADEPSRYSDEDQMEVRISKPFAIMTTEVTQSQWVQVMGNNPSRFKSAGVCGDDHDSEKDMCPNHPVERVSWNDVQDYIKKLNDSLELTDCDGTPSSSTGCYRLPTEAEWEYATRGGTATAYSFGADSSDLGDYAWYGGNSKGKTHPVGEKEPNPWGLYDVHGNVWEWVQDMYTSDLPGGEDPLHTSGLRRVFRGGSWINYARDLRSANRYYIPTYGYSNIGFRLVRTL